MTVSQHVDSSLRHSLRRKPYVGLLNSGDRSGSDGTAG